eukprot:jgi/Tetstr1/461131/TSEL_006270.t1
MAPRAAPDGFALGGRRLYWAPLLAAAALLLGGVPGAHADGTASVYRDGEAWRLQPGVLDASAAAYGRSELVGGWTVLDMAAGQEVPRDDALFALGYLEAFFTCGQMEVFVDNYLDDLFRGKPAGKRLVAFAQENLDWLRGQVAASGTSDERHEYWSAVGDVLAQFDGLLEGYAEFCASSREMFTIDLLLLNMLGDLYDVMPALARRDHGTDAKGMSALPRKLSRRTGIDMAAAAALQDRPSHCSAAIKLEQGAQGSYKDITVGHTTWDGYTNAFPRTFKHITLPSEDPTREPFTESFSSSPGLLTSMDDFYITSGPSSLFVMETSLNVLDSAKYDSISAESVPCWIRVMVANRLAKSGSSWSDLFSENHSGTYNDQWMVVDRTRFEPGVAPKAGSGLFWMTEEAPGLIKSADMTAKLLADGFWGSYNVPYFPEIREALGYEALSKQNEEMSYTNATRARQFKELVQQAEGLEGMDWLIRWNGWSADADAGASPASPAKAIAARGDLVPMSLHADDNVGMPSFRTKVDLAGRPGAWGAIDSKVASWSAWSGSSPQGPAALIQLGPTTQQQPAFCWTSEFKDPCKGHPACFEFPKLNITFSALRHLVTETQPLVDSAVASSAAQELHVGSPQHTYS